MADVDTFNQAYGAGHDKQSGKRSAKKTKNEQGAGKVVDWAKKAAKPFKFHKGGKVKKGGYAKVKKGEVVMTIAQQKSAGIKKGGKKKASARKRVASKG